MGGLCWRTREEGLNPWDATGSILRYSTGALVEGVTPLTALGIHSTTVSISGFPGKSARQPRIQLV